VVRKREVEAFLEELLYGVGVETEERKGSSFVLEHDALR
jgi:hypothetical protein